MWPKRLQHIKQQKTFDDVFLQRKNSNTKELYITQLDYNYTTILKKNWMGNEPKKKMSSIAEKHWNTIHVTPETTKEENSQ